MRQFKENLKDAWNDDRSSFIMNIVSIIISLVAVILSTICIIHKFA